MTVVFSSSGACCRVLFSWEISDGYVLPCLWESSRFVKFGTKSGTILSVYVALTGHLIDGIRRARITFLELVRVRCERDGGVAVTS